MERGLISVIIPIYNVENYLRECLDSLKRQSYTNYEVLMIDDGSTDKSSQICKEYANDNPKFMYYYQDNSGPSAARNYGINKSTGNFIVFIDADDMVDANYLELHIYCIENFHCELSICSYEKFYQDNKNCYKLSDFPYSIINDQLDIAKIYKTPSTNLFGISVWGKMYKKEIIINNHILFPLDISYEEDCCFNVQYFKCIKNIIIIRDTVYHYRQIDSSLSKNYNDNTIAGLVKGYNTRKEFISHLKMTNEDIKGVDTVFLTALINNYKKISTSLLNSYDKKQAYKNVLSYKEAKLVFGQANTSKTRLTRYLIWASKKENIFLISMILKLWIFKKNIISKLKGTN